METSLKNWLCPNFLSLPKKCELPKLCRGCSPPRPPGPYAYVYEKKVDSVACANRACASSDCLKQHSRKLWLSRFDPKIAWAGRVKCFYGENPPLPSQNDDPARKLKILAKQTFCFSVKQFATFCKEMYGKLARPRGSLGRRGVLLPRDNFFRINERPNHFL